jgi:toxin ParE1/3/4
VRQREVVFAPEAPDDPWRLYEAITAAAGMSIALAYIERIETYCLGFDLASERGHLRDDIRAGLRIVGFERRVTIAFSVDDARVTILRVFYAAGIWKARFDDLRGWSR